MSQNAETTTPLREDYGRIPPPKGWKAGRDSYSKLWLVPLGGGKPLIFGSLDWRSPKSKTLSQRLGIKRFENLLAKPEYRHDVAIIYDAATNDKLAIYRQGVKVEGTI